MCSCRLTDFLGPPVTLCRYSLGYPAEVLSSDFPPRQLFETGRRTSAEGIGFASTVCLVTATQSRVALGAVLAIDWEEVANSGIPETIK